MQILHKITLTLLVFILLFTGYFHYITALSQDLGRHLKTGELILATKSVPAVNLFSYTYPQFPFINHHWLSEVIFFIVHQMGGFPLLFILMLVLILVGFGIVFHYASRRFSFPAVIIASSLYLPILFERTDLRPELFSFFFLTLTLVILFTYRERFTRTLYLLPVILFLWVNLHIYFFIGILTLFIFLFDELVRERKKLTNNHTKVLLIVTLASCIAIFFNPHGLQGALYPLRVFDNYGYTIEENQTFYLLESLGFHKPSVPFFKLGVLLLFGNLLINIKKTRLIDWLLSISFTVIGAMAVRNFPLFVFATFIPFSLALTHTFTLLTEWLKKYPRQYISLIQSIGYLCLTLFLLFQIQKGITSETFGYTVVDEAENGVNFMIENNITGPIFNNFDIGSYLSYRLYPREKVFIDGRPEAYPARFIQNVYIPMQQDIKNFDTVDNLYSFNTIFFSHTDQTPWARNFLPYIIRHKDWKTIYLDDYTIILIKNDEKNRDIIARFAMQPENVRIRNVDLSDMQSLLRLANFFNLTSITDQEIIIYQQILTKNPNYCPALYNMGVLLSHRGDPTAGVFAQRYQMNCQQ